MGWDIKSILLLCGDVKGRTHERTNAKRKTRRQGDKETRNVWCELNDLPVDQVGKGEWLPSKLSIDPDTDIVHCSDRRQARQKAR